MDMVRMGMGTHLIGIGMEWEWGATGGMGIVSTNLQYTET